MYKFEMIKAKDMDDITNRYEKEGWKVVTISMTGHAGMTSGSSLFGVLFHKEG